MNFAKILRIVFFTLYCLKQPYTAFFLLVYLTEKHLELHLVPRDIYNKRFVLKNYVKTHLEIFLSNYAEFRIHGEKNRLCFYEKSI